MNMMISYQELVRTFPNWRLPFFPTNSHTPTSSRKTEMAISSAFSLEAAGSKLFPIPGPGSPRSMSFVSMVGGVIQVGFRVGVLL